MDDRSSLQPFRKFLQLPLNTISKNANGARAFMGEFSLRCGKGKAFLEGPFALFAT